MYVFMQHFFIKVQECSLVLSSVLFYYNTTFISLEMWNIA